MIHLLQAFFAVVGVLSLLFCGVLILIGFRVLTWWRNGR